MPRFNPRSCLHTRCIAYRTMYRKKETCLGTTSATPHRRLTIHVPPPMMGPCSTAPSLPPLDEQTQGHDDYLIILPSPYIYPFFPCPR